MVVVQNSFFPGTAILRGQNITFAKFSRTLCLSFAKPILGNNASYEDSFITGQIAPNYHRSLLDTLMNMLSGQIVAD